MAGLLGGAVHGDTVGAPPAVGNLRTARAGAALRAPPAGRDEVRAPDRRCGPYAGAMVYGGSVGHGWVVLIPFAIFMALRVFGQGRRRSGAPQRRRPVPGTNVPLVGPGTPPPGAGFAPPEARGPVAPGGRGSGIGTSGIAPGWLVDPTGRHEQRYWSGSEWTEHVTDAGAPGIDPPPGRSGGNDGG